MITLTTKGLAALCLDVVHTQGMAERSNKLAELKLMLAAIGAAGTPDTLQQIAEMIAETPKLGETIDWWQP